MFIEDEARDKVSTKYFSQAYEKLPQRHKFLCDLFCELDDLEEVFGKEYVPKP